MSWACPSCPLCALEGAGLLVEVDERRYHRCSRCALIFLAPDQLPDRARELETYRWHRNDPADQRYRDFLARLTEPLLEHLSAGMRGLDFGCGPGPTIAPMLAGHGLRMASYDPFFRRRSGLLRRRYDFITCTEVIEHLHTPGRELAMLDGLLRPGGWLGVMTGMIEDETGFATWWYRRDPTHVGFYREPTMRWIAGWRGWRLLMPAPGIALFQKTSGLTISSGSR